MVVGISHGEGKPDPDIFLKEFVDEMTLLVTSGTIIDDKYIEIKFHNLICDVPAKAYLLNTKGHTGFYSCYKCDIRGRSIKGPGMKRKQICFASSNFNLCRIQEL